MATLQEMLCKRIYIRGERAEDVLSSLKDYELDGLKTDLQHQYTQGQLYRQTPEHVCRKLVQLSRIHGGQIDIWAFTAGFLGQELDIRQLLVDIRM